MAQKEEMNYQKQFSEMNFKEKRNWIKQILLKKFHSDIIGKYEVAPDAESIVTVLTQLLNMKDQFGDAATDFKGWPISYKENDGEAKYTLPGEGSIDDRTFYLPMTPEEFLESIYDYLKYNLTDLLLREPPLRMLSIDGTFSEKVKINEDDSYIAYEENLNKISSIEELNIFKEKFDIFTIYDPIFWGPLLKLWNDKALEILTKMSSDGTLTNHDLDKIKFNSIEQSENGLRLINDDEYYNKAKKLVSETAHDRESENTNEKSKKYTIRDISKMITSLKSSKDENYEKILEIIEDSHKHLNSSQINMLKALLRLKISHLTKK
jgi:hypothetical protein